MPFAQALIAATVAKLASGVSVEPEPFATTSGMVYLYTAAAIAQARVQENERCAKAAEVYMILHYGFDYGVMAEIRALIGKETP